MKSPSRKKFNGISMPGFKADASIYKNHEHYEQYKVIGVFAPSELMSKSAYSYSREYHWTNKLFVEHLEIFLPALESRKEKALRDVEGLCKIFTEFRAPQEAKILDLSCGIGRHSIPLVKKGHQVVGYDLSPLYIDRAKQLAKKKYEEEGLNLKKIRFYQGDSRDAAQVLSSKREIGFNIIISMFSSIGYFGEEEDFRMFKDLLNIASHNCILVIETQNRDQLMRITDPFETFSAEKGFETHQISRFNIENSYIQEELKLYKRMPDNSLKLMYSLPATYRVYSLHELKKIINKAGWRYLKAYGNLDTLEPFTFKSESIILVAQRSN